MRQGFPPEGRMRKVHIVLLYDMFIRSCVLFDPMIYTVGKGVLSAHASADRWERGVPIVLQ
jgi:hypothetical protein